MFKGKKKDFKNIGIMKSKENMAIALIQNDRPLFSNCNSIIINIGCAW